MSLFGALSELIGGAVLAAAPACDLIMPDEVLGQRSRFVSWLSVRDEIGEIRKVVDGLGREIWMGAETRGLAQRDLEHHVQSAGEIISRHPPTPAHLAELAGILRSGHASEPRGSTPLARRMADDIVARAAKAGRIVDLGLLDDVLSFLIERSFAPLVSEARTLPRLGAALAEFVAECEPRTAAVAPAATGLATFGISKAFVQRLEAAGGLTYLGELGERYGLAERAMRRLVALIDSQTTISDERILRLEHLAQWLGDVRAQLLRPSNDEVDVRRRKTAAASALAEGDFEAAMDQLRQVRRELREARRRTEERLQEDAIALKSQMLEEARATARLAELTAARGEHAQAAELFAEAAMSLPRADRDAAWRFGLQRADQLLQQARQHDEATALAEALAAYSHLVRSAAEGANTRALAEACLGHGDALTLAGEREPGAARLKDAVTIYQRAIQLLERERDQTQLVRARLAYARAYARLGERDRAPDILRKAAQAFRDAAVVVIADKRPAEHAGLKMGLGSMLVLLAIEEREGGVPLLAEAADAYRGALEVLDQETETERWGEAKFNLGLALLGLGEHEGSSSHLEEAVTSFKDCLEATPRIRVPHRWALAQMNLGNALAALGERDTTGPGLFEEAIEAYNAALEELVRDAEPLKWAIAQMNLGTALIRLGERREKRRHWLGAASALVPALEVFETERADHFAEMTRRHLKSLQDGWDSFIGLPAAATATEPARSPVEPMRIAKAG